MNVYSGVVDGRRRESNAGTVDQLLAGVLEVDGNPLAIHRLHLAEAPVGAIGVPHKIAWSKKWDVPALVFGQFTLLRAPVSITDVL